MTGVMDRLGRAVRVGLAMDGVRVARRAAHEIARRSGYLRARYPRRELGRWCLADATDVRERLRRGTGFPTGERGPGQRIEEYRAAFGDAAGALAARADRIVAGGQPYFFDRWHDFDGVPDWFANPFTDEGVSPDRHWTELGFFSPAYGDLKFIVEPGRFTAAYALSRAYLMTGEERYAERFWVLAEDWVRRNPPQGGVGWLCGQEASFRVMAWCFALYGLAGSEHSTLSRVATLIAAIGAHADRIAGTVGYARSQKNNHALSEGAALWTVALLFPEFHRAAGWKERGRELLEAETAEQVYGDGSYVQHSMNYHRVMLHDLLWALRLGEVHGERLSEETYRRFGLATEFLVQLTDASGGAPNLGPNDGTLVLPLSECGYDDYRPTLQAAYRLAHGRRLLPRGPWDEAVFWLFGETPAADAAPDAPDAPRRSRSYPVGGYYTMRGSDSWALLRCARFRDRPAQADQLHLDLWWRGVNLLCDAGTYLYNATGLWDNGLASTAVHNTVTVDGRDQMTRATRFQWVDWAAGRIRRRAAAGPLEYLEAEHDGYGALGLTHRRAVVRADRVGWVVIDDVLGDAGHEAVSHWLLPDLEHRLDAGAGRLDLETPAGPVTLWMKGPVGASPSLVREGKAAGAASDRAADRLRGWRSTRYGRKDPALSLVLRSPTPCRFVTVLADAAADLELDAARLVLSSAAATLRLGLAEPAAGRRPVDDARLETGGRAHALALSLEGEPA